MTEREAARLEAEARARQARGQALAHARRWRRLDCAATVGALTLRRENAHHLASLNTWAAIVAAGVPHGAIKGSREDTKALLRCLKGWVGIADDPAATSHVVRLAFHGGNYSFFPEDPTSLFALQRVYEALAWLIEREDVGHSVVEFLLGVALLSNAIAARLDVVGPEACSRSSTDVFIPNDAQLRHLRKAVIFRTADIAALLGEFGLGPEALDPLVLKDDTITSLDNEPYNATTVDLHPLLRIDDHYVVYAPRCLISSSLHHTWDMVRRAGILELFARALHDATRHALNRALCFIGAAPFRVPPKEHVTKAYLSRTWYRIDIDKAIVVTLVTEAPCVDEPLRAHWEGDLTDAVCCNERRPLTTHGSRYAVQHIVSVLGTCRSIHLDTGPPRARQLGMRADELEAIAWSEAYEGDALLLWRFGEEHERIARLHRFFSHDTSDIYAVWRTSRLTVPEGPSATPAHIIVAYGSARDLRERAHRDMDFHGEPNHTADGVVTVMRMDTDLPGVFVAVGSPTLYVAIFGSMRLWVTGADETSTYPTYLLARALGYWLSQLQTALSGPVLANERVCNIVVTFSGGTTPIAAAHTTTQPPFTVTQVADHVSVVIDDAFWEGVSSGGNLAETALIGAVLQAALQSFGVAAEDIVRCTATLRSVAQRLSQSQLLHSFDTRSQPALIHRSFLPRLRNIRTSERDAARRLLRLGLAKDRGDHSDAAATRVVNDAVTLLYEELGRVISAMDPRSALATCLEQVEAQIASDTEREFTLEAAIACASSRDAAVAAHNARWAESSSRATASRFLVELVVGQQPCGRSRMSSADFDYCLGLAAEIVHLGCISDISHFRVAPVHVRVSDLGLDVSLPSYQMASAVVSTFLSTASLREEPRIAEEDQDRELDPAASEEFGFSFNELARLVGELLEIAELSHASHIEMPLPQFLEAIATAMRWPSERAKSLQAFWGLTPRTSFFAGLPPGLRTSDVYPWRMNRPYSYIRRPLIWGYNGSVLLTAGHVARALHYILRTCIEGRLNARSQRMKSCMSAMANRAAYVANDRVAQRLRDCGYETWVRVGRFSGVRLLGPKGDLGDIDVVALDRSRRELWCLECKDLSLGRAPHEVHSDLVGLFRGSATTRSFQDKLLARVAWVNEHRAAVARHLGLSEATQLNVRAAFVFSQPMVSPLLGEATVPILFEEQLRGRYCLRNIRTRTGEDLLSGAR